MRNHYPLSFNCLFNTSSYDSLKLVTVLLSLVRRNLIFESLLGSFTVYVSTILVLFLDRYVSKTLPHKIRLPSRVRFKSFVLS